MTRNHRFLLYSCLYVWTLIGVIMLMWLFMVATPGHVVTVTIDGRSHTVILRPSR